MAEGGESFELFARVVGFGAGEGFGQFRCRGGLGVRLESRSNGAGLLGQRLGRCGFAGGFGLGRRLRGGERQRALGRGRARGVLELGAKPADDPPPLLLGPVGVERLRPPGDSLVPKVRLPFPKPPRGRARLAERIQRFGEHNLRIHGRILPT